MAELVVQEEVKGESAQRVVVITGAATGIGAATARKFAQEGYALLLGDVKDEELAALVSELKSLTDAVLAVRCDVTDQASIKAMVAVGMAQFGHIDYLFVNAGIHRNNSILTLTPEELELMVKTNVFGAVYTIQAVVPYMIEQGQGSILINCSDQWFIGKKNNFAYGLTKGALGQITRSLAVELGEYHIRVNAICPGTIDTPIAQSALGKYAARVGMSLEDAYAEERELFILKRLGTPEEVANMAYFILTQATFSTGSHFGIEGGISAS